MRFKKIQTKVFIAMLITSLIPVGIISAILLFMITQTIHTEVSVSTNRTAVDIQEKVEDYFLNLNNGVYNIYYNTKLLKALQNGSGIQAVNTDDYEVSQDIRRFFASLYNFSKINDILGIYLFNQKGDLVDYFTIIVLHIIWTSINFDFIWIMTQGGPLHSSETLPVLIYRMAMKEYNYGGASALSSMMMGLMIVCAFAYFMYNRTHRNGR
ncbi:hypothetical protein BG53_13595 [Paenibacillus darwinianus]|uniref:Sugar ABC transporter permease n=1 Tax=Paenibacillus darwinianus TaxID=1380763 RepID=A0A9W5W8B7_9BACL|nr:sugar ABC transporter permease [Paenibacillus darwinianus]EXX90420.1 hypothetical protein BG53_13595 [Paenibacillus darwinianus]EXX91109.1 hypothetical protein BG52_11475 [Paenibacillus darwinianus]EXX92024.1 hypothetical protein CH50_12240 [Paenibacillus darwinianus]